MICEVFRLSSMNIVGYVMQCIAEYIMQPIYVLPVMYTVLAQSCICMVYWGWREGVGNAKGEGQRGSLLPIHAPPTVSYLLCMDISLPTHMLLTHPHGLMCGSV